MKVKALIIIFSSFCLSGAFAQSLTSAKETKITDLMLMSKNGEASGRLDYKSIEGSPYNKDKFTNGTIEFIVGPPVKDIEIRINLFENVVEFKNENEIYILADFSKIKAIKLGGEVYAPRVISEKVSLKNVIVQLLVSGGNIELLKKENISFHDAKPAVNSYANPTPAYFRVDKPTFYLKMKNLDPVEIDKRKLKNLPGKYYLLSKYAKKIRNKGKSEEDLITLVASFNNNR